MLSLPLTTQAPRAARRWVAADDLVAPNLRARVVLMVSELVANSVLHSGLPPTDRVGIAVTAIPDGLRVDVVDDGEGIGSVAPGRHSFGLRLVDRLADRWGHSDRPTRVWFEITSDPSSDAPG